MNCDKIDMGDTKADKIATKFSTADDDDKITGPKRILCICILIYGRFLNGIINGLSSPSILSFEKDLKNSTGFEPGSFNSLLPK